MCHSDGTFIFSQEEEEKVLTKTRWWKQWPVAKNLLAMGSGDSE